MRTETEDPGSWDQVDYDAISMNSASPQPPPAGRATAGAMDSRLHRCDRSANLGPEAARSRKRDKPSTTAMTTMQLTGATLIADQEIEGAGPGFRTVDPASGTVLEPEFRESLPADVDRALRAAASAFESYGRTDATVRATFLRAIAEEVLELGELLIERCSAETGLPAARLQNERVRTVNQLRLFADHIEEGSWIEARIDRADPTRAPIPKPGIRRMLIPLGPVAVFGASNFPLAFSVAGGDTASALAAGCPVVFKAHPAHPGTSELVARAIGRAARKTGIAPAVFSLLHGWSHEVGLSMVRHPLTRAVGFTGSHRGGRALFDAAAARPEPIPVYAEMGSVNPVFLLPSAVELRAESLAQGLAQSITLGAGQFCTNPGVVVGVKGAGLSRLTAELCERIRGTAPGVMLYEGLRSGYETGLERVRSKGAEAIAASEEKPTDPSFSASATLLATDAQRFVLEPALHEEVFGPCSLLVTAGDVSELERVAEALEGQLTATIHGTEEELAANRRLIEILQGKVGRLIFNGFPTGVEVGHAMQHGGPYPASSDVRSTSVGTAAITRFARPVCYQDFPDAALPSALRDRNELGIWRMVDGELTRKDV
jgi:2,5-dioxopentanoate dehydrogenase